MERRRLERRQRRLLDERAKLLQAHYADAVPLELLRTEQKRIADALTHIDQRLKATDYEHELVDANLKAALALATNAQAMYITAADPVRRQLNQALFRQIRIDDGGDVTSELAAPFDVLLSPQVRELATAPRASEPAAASKPDWQEWEASLNEEGAHGLVGASRSGRPSRGRGLNYETLVGAGGFEPP